MSSGPTVLQLQKMCMFQNKHCMWSVSTTVELRSKEEKETGGVSFSYSIHILANAIHINRHAHPQVYTHRVT